jgi:hypothetical protein
VLPIIGASGIGVIGASLVALPSSPHAAATSKPTANPRLMPACYSSYR